MAIFLKPNELGDSYRSSENEARTYFEPFDEYERLAANKVRPDLPKIYPRVNEGTLSSMMLENAKRVFPDMFTGAFTSIDRDEQWLVELSNIIWNRVIVPGAESDADFYIKFWNLFYRCQQHGKANAFVFFTANDNYTGADFTNDYIKDVLLEPGKISVIGSNYVWRNSYHTKLDLQNIIAYAEQDHRTAKKQGRDRYSTWDIGVLKEFVNRGPMGKSEQEKNLSEREKQLAATHYKLSTAYHRGFNAPFYTVIPSIEFKLCRTRFNENPTGDVPIVEMFHTQDLINPYGKGLVETAGPTQNVLDYFTQADVLSTQKGMQPPVKIKGADTSGLVLTSITHSPDARWRVGNADVSVVDMGTSIYSQLSNHMAGYKSNLMNQMGAFDTTVSSSSGNPQFSKTDAGVNNLEARSNVNDNFFANSGSSAFRRLAKIMMNVHMANMQGKELFTLLSDEVERLEKAGWNLNKNNRIQIDYDKTRAKFDFKVDDPANLNDPETEGLATVIKTITPEVAEQIEADGDYKVDLGEAYVQYFQKLQLTNLDKIIVPIDSDANMGGESESGEATPQVDSNGNPIPPKGTNSAPTVVESADLVKLYLGTQDPDLQNQIIKQLGFTPTPPTVVANQVPSGTPTPQIPVTTAQPTPPAQSSQTELPPEDPAALKAEHAATMQKHGVNENVAAAIMAARRLGYTDQEVESYLQNQQTNGGQQ